MSYEKTQMTFRYKIIRTCIPNVPKNTTKFDKKMLVRLFFMFIYMSFYFSLFCEEKKLFLNESILFWTFLTLPGRKIEQFYVFVGIFFLKGKNINMLKTISKIINLGGFFFRTGFNIYMFWWFLDWTVLKLWRSLIK